MRIPCAAAVPEGTECGRGQVLSRIDDLPADAAGALDRSCPENSQVWEQSVPDRDAAETVPNSADSPVDHRVDCRAMTAGPVSPCLRRIGSVAVCRNMGMALLQAQ